MKNKKKLSYLLYLTSIAFLPWLVSLSFHKCLELLIIHWWNPNQSETLLNSIQEKHVLERFIESEELFLLDEMIKEYPKIYIQKLPIEIHKETIQLVKTHNKYYLDIILNFSTNIISFTILSSYLILSKEELIILNSWGQEFLYNLSDTKKALLMILVIELAVGYHSTGVWELLIDSLCDFGLVNRGPISSILVSIIPVILHSSFYYWVFDYLNRVSPSLVVIFNLINR
uniref:envelope membrane carbon uptake protein n=1 Tax=Juncus roemerianus TaxID=879918 RepID=UPI00237B572E|nr:envelope membrane carbon uptake protein [Juncus roemerianus]UZM11262.1 envelope membrane carbon uptake protein [Juncus roemerianus]